MSFEDWSFEMPFEQDDYDDIGGGYFGVDYSSTFIKPKAIKRVCTACERKFKSAYPQACPACGGWTQTKKQLKAKTN